MSCGKPDRGHATGTVSPEAAGLLVSMLETGLLDLHRSRAVRRLRELRDSSEFGSLPDDLRLRIREIVSEDETLD